MRRSLSVHLLLLASLGAATGCSSAPDSDMPPGRAAVVIGSRGRLPGHFSFPRGIDVDSKGRIAVADRTGRIQILSPDGKPLHEWVLPAYENGTPTGIAFDATRPGETTLLIADTHYNRILRYSLDGALVRQFGEYGETRDKMIYPTDVALDPKGNIYVTEYGLHDRVMKFTRDGELIDQWGDFGTEVGKFQRPLGLAFAPPDRLVIADTCNHRLQVFTLDGQLLGAWGEVGSGPGQFKYPYDVAIGPDGRIYVCEYGNNRVQCLDATGRSIGCYGQAGRRPGEFATPWGVAATPDGNLVVADTNNHRLQVVSPEAVAAAD